MASSSVTLDGPADVSIVHAARADFTISAAPWPFARERRAEIDAYFAQMQKSKPELWNGSVLLFRNCSVAAQCVTGEAFETDYASFSAWHAWRRPDPSIKNCFALPAVEGSDGGFLLGVMAAHTANAGHVYFPCGTPDPDDIVAGCVDLDLSARRELLEETGLDIRDLDAQPGWTVVSIGPFIALFKRLRSPLTADELRARALRHLNDEGQPELADIVIVRERKDIVAAMPPFVSAFLHHVL